MTDVYRLVDAAFRQLPRVPMMTSVANRVPAFRRILNALAAPEAASEAPVTPLATPKPVEAVLGQRRAFSHWGEDQVIAYLLNNKRDGFYVDVGCFHPTLYSNTKLLFDAGWTGVNIDPNPFMIEQFKTARPRDTNLQMAISDTSGSEIDFFMFNDWGSSNTASPEFAQQIVRGQSVKVKQKLRVRCETLGNIFDQHCARKTIDFLNVDVEALDLKVLQSSDWEKWRPSLIAIEDFEFVFAEPASSPIYSFLIGKRYQMVSRNVYTSFFVSQESGIRL